MRNILLILNFLFIVTISSTLFAQGIVNNGAAIVLTNSANIYVDGGSNAGFLNSGAAQINSDGTILLEGDWTNNGSTDVFTNIDNQGSVNFVGSTAQQIGGSHSTTFENIDINNSGSDVILDYNQVVSYNLTMTQGDLDLKDKTVDLGANGTLVNETVNRRLKSTDGAGIDGNGTGTIFATRNNPTGNVAGLGLTVNLGSNGSTTVYRGHLVQSGTGSFSANSSVFRYYQVSPVTNAGGGTSVTFHDCFTPELNGHGANELIMYQWMEHNNSGIEYWHPIPDNNSGSSVSITQTLDLATLNYIKVTLGSETKPLPVEMVELKARCVDNVKEIFWETASEQNSDYFELYSSINGVDYNYLTSITAAGFSNQNIKYNHIDLNEYNSNIVYYKVVQYDFNGNTNSYFTKVQDCNTKRDLEMDILTNPSREWVKINVKSINKGSYNLAFYDNIGKLMVQKKVQIDDETQTITINTSNLSDGYYNVVLFDNFSKVSKLLLIKK